jgi:hypothetical protein
MNTTDQMTAYYTKFMALSFFTRRLIIFVASIALWWFAAMLASMHVNNELCVILLLAGAAGALWSSELWRLWKVFATIAVICIAILK